MITTAIINIAYYILSGILNVLPSSAGFPTEVMDSAHFLGNYTSLINFLIPIETFITVIGIIFTVDIAIYGFRSVRWIMSHIPWVGGHGN